MARTRSSCEIFHPAFRELIVRMLRREQTHEAMSLAARELRHLIEFRKRRPATDDDEGGPELELERVPLESRWQVIIRELDLSEGKQQNQKKELDYGWD